MAFAALNTQHTPQSFASYLAAHAPPVWVKGSCYHNTYKPTEADWRGEATMDAMQAHYVSLGWSSGPHLFLALDAPNPAHNGIWIMTPPTQPGTHAGDCNSGFFGVEVVGNFQAALPSAAQQDLLIDTLALLHRWARLGPVLVAHRDCMPGRTCPGDAFYALKPSLQRRLQSVLSADPWPARWGPIATPDQTSWEWDVPKTWKLHWQRLGQCISSALYDHAHGLVVQCFEGGDVRQRAGQAPEVTFQ